MEEQKKEKEKEKEKKKYKKRGNDKRKGRGKEGAKRAWTVRYTRLKNAEQNLSI